MLKSLTKAASKAASKAGKNAKSFADKAKKNSSSLAAKAKSAAAQAKSAAESASASAASNLKAASAAAASKATAVKNATASAGKNAVKKMEDGRQYMNDVEVFKKFNPVIWILAFNLFLRLMLYFSSNVGKKKANKLKKEYTRKHVKETFGIAVISIFIIWYLTFKFDQGQTSPQALRDGIMLSLYLNVFMYDYVKNFTKMINKRYFRQNKKQGAKLGGIYFGIVLGLFAFFGILVIMLHYIQVKLFPDHYSMFGPEFENYKPIIVALVIFVVTFAVAIPNFFIVNPEMEKTKRKYKGDMKQYYIDSFKLFFIVYLTMYLILIIAMNLNIEKVNSIFGKFI